MSNTQDLSKFGYIELKEAAELLTAYADHQPDWLGNDISIEFNPNSGCVFMVDEDYNTAMMSGDELAQWHNCPECGTGGFLDDMIEYGKDCCHEWLIESGLMEEEDIETEA